jgi:integrase
MPTAKRGKRRSITESERKYFLEVASTHPAGLMFKTMLYCGLRNGEVVALSWDGVKPEQRIFSTFFVGVPCVRKRLA